MDTNLKLGSIYAYNDPVTGHPVYVGSTRDGNTMRRHAVHLREKTSIGPWLRSFSDPPIPYEIEKPKYDTAAVLLQREAHFQKELCTLRSQGGLNKILAWPAPDHSVIGKLGGGNRPMSADAKKRMLSGTGATEDAKKRHKLGSLKGGEAARGIPRTYSEISRIAFRNAGKLGRSRVKHEDIVKAAILGGQVGNHQRWHVARGIFKSGCSLCDVKI